jgi:cytidylate kinase
MRAVAIDGPSAAGKSTLSRRLAGMLGFLYIDTGALYRAVGLFMTRRLGCCYDDKEAIINALPECDIKMSIEDGTQAIFLGKEPVDDKIRTPEISMAASAVSAIAEVRAFLLDFQNNAAQEQSIVMDGRDIGTMVLPKAEVKIFLVAGSVERARRRYAEFLAKGERVTIEQVHADLLERDANDSARGIAPLRPASDAVTIDTTNLDLDEALEAIYRVCAEKLGL